MLIAKFLQPFERAEDGVNIKNSELSVFFFVDHQGRLRGGGVISLTMSGPKPP